MLFGSLVLWLILCLDTLCFWWGGGGYRGVFVVCTALPLETGGSNHDDNLTSPLAQLSRLASVVTLQHEPLNYTLPWCCGLNIMTLKLLFFHFYFKDNDVWN
jgi:hypothetical protein